MKYTLMHKDVEVVDLDINPEKGSIDKMLEPHNLKHLPCSIQCRKGIADKNMLDDWWDGRCIPISRSNLTWFLQVLNVKKPQALLTKSYGLSLSDQYWIKPYNENITWSDINFFENNFSEDIGDILVGSKSSSKNIDKRSPDTTSSGDLPKRWKIISSKRVLLKGSTRVYRQQVFNEIIAYKIANLLNINAIEYKLYWNGREPYCGCEDFITPDEDLVSAWDLMLSKKQPNNMSNYQHIVNVAKENGINDIVDNLNKMLVLDYIIANEDRHLNNFGFIRDVNTLEFKGFAPIYDTGSALAYNIDTREIKYYKPEWKPFHHGKINVQLDLVTDFSWINIEKLDLIPSIIEEVAKDSKEYIDDIRTKELINFVNQRIEILKQYIAKDVK